MESLQILPIFEYCMCPHAKKVPALWKNPSIKNPLILSFFLRSMERNKLTRLHPELFAENPWIHNMSVSTEYDVWGKHSHDLLLKFLPNIQIIWRKPYTVVTERFTI